MTSAGLFEVALSPHGTWVIIPEYGRVWRPNPEIVGTDFRPFSSGGHWVHTEYGWSWASDWDWGWAPFHYGRWMFNSVWGWVWVPGTIWGPAWVDWRYGGEYVGWAPLAPVGYVWLENRPRWFFCRANYMISPNHLYAFALNPDELRVAMAVTRPVSTSVAYRGTHFFVGPPVAEIAKVAQQEIQTLKVSPPDPGVVQRVFTLSHRRSPAAETTMKGDPMEPVPLNANPDQPPASAPRQPATLHRSVRPSPEPTGGNPHR